MNIQVTIYRMVDLVTNRNCAYQVTQRR